MDSTPPPLTPVHTNRQAKLRVLIGHEFSGRRSGCLVVKVADYSDWLIARSVLISKFGRDRNSIFRDSDSEAAAECRGQAFPSKKK